MHMPVDDPTSAALRGVAELLDTLLTGTSGMTFEEGALELAFVRFREELDAALEVELESGESGAVERLLRHWREHVDTLLLSLRESAVGEEDRFGRVFVPVEVVREVILACPPPPILD